MQPSDLANEDLTDRLTTLVETQPDLYLPRLGLLVRQATREQLRENKGGLGRKGSRRTLVWTAERLAAFPKHFGEAQEILRRLALAENEDGIGNNATEIWKQMFRIVLSGAATPFRERIELLGKLVFSSDTGESALAIGALNTTLDLTRMRAAGPYGTCGPTCPARLEAKLHGTISGVSGADTRAVRPNLRPGHASDARGSVVNPVQTHSSAARAPHVAHLARNRRAALHPSYSPAACSRIDRGLASVRVPRRVWRCRQRSLL